MSKLSELRNRSRASRELQEQKVERVKSAVHSVVNSSAFALSALNNLGDDVNDSQIQEFAETVATRVADVITDPRNEFIDSCKARGLSEFKIKKIVDSLNSMFALTDSENYDERLEAVSLYLQKYPHLYEDINMLA